MLWGEAGPILQSESHGLRSGPADGCRMAAWCGAVWCGVVWCGVVQCDVVRGGAACGSMHGVREGLPGLREGR